MEGKKKLAKQRKTDERGGGGTEVCTLTPTPLILHIFFFFFKGRKYIGKKFGIFYLNFFPFLESSGKDLKKKTPF